MDTHQRRLELCEARIGAIEFMVRQIYLATLKAAGGDLLESALATQGRAMMDMKRQLAAANGTEGHGRLAEMAQHVNRLFEEIVQAAERGRDEQDKTQQT